MTGLSLHRKWAPALLASFLGLASFLPSTARADDDLVRVLVDIADVVIHSGHPYYRHGSYGRYDRLIVERDPYRRPVYYRYVPRGYTVVYRAPPYGPAYGHRDYRGPKCTPHGRCQSTYYDPRYDRSNGYRHDRDRRDYGKRDSRKYDRRWSGR